MHFGWLQKLVCATQCSGKTRWLMKHLITENSKINLTFLDAYSDLIFEWQSAFRIEVSIVLYSAIVTWPLYTQVTLAQDGSNFCLCQRRHMQCHLPGARWSSGAVASSIHLSALKGQVHVYGSKWFVLAWRCTQATFVTVDGQCVLGRSPWVEAPTAPRRRPFTAQLPSCPVKMRVQSPSITPTGLRWARTEEPSAWPFVSASFAHKWKALHLLLLAGADAARAIYLSGSSYVNLFIFGQRPLCRGSCGCGLSG